MGAASGDSAPGNQSRHERSPIRVLLWSPAGAGEHYHGPGILAYRLYSLAEPAHLTASLAHGYPEQARYAVFRDQHFIHPLRSTPLSVWMFLRRARAWIDEHAREFDIFHGIAGFHPTMMPALWASNANLPAVVYLASHEMDLADKYGWKGVLGLPGRRRKLAHRLDAMVAMSGAIFEELISYGIPERKIARIPTAVDVAMFRPVEEHERRALRARFGWHDALTVIFVGGLTPRKRPHLLIESVALAKRRGVDCQVAFVGPEHDPAYVAQMKALASSLGVESIVQWVGFTPDVSPFFQASDCFALPSSNEGMPAALAEAMATGIPSIVTAISGTIDLVTDGVEGRIVDPNASEITDVLVDYFKTSPKVARAHGQAARRKVEQRCSLPAVLDAYEQLFHRLLRGGDAAA